MNYAVRMATIDELDICREGGKFCCLFHIAIQKGYGVFEEESLSVDYKTRQYNLTYNAQL